MAESRHGRTFGPLFGLLLADILAQAVSDAIPSLSLDHTSPWLSQGYIKPLPNPSNYLQWYPIENPYGHNYQEDPYPLSTVPHENHYHNNYEDYYQTSEDKSRLYGATAKPEIPREPSLTAESSMVVRRRRPAPYRTYVNRPNRYQSLPIQRKRRTTTTEPSDYYDDDERNSQDDSFEVERKRRPYNLDESYEEDYLYNVPKTDQRRYKNKNVNRNNISKRTRKPSNRNRKQNQRRREQLDLENDSSYDDYGDTRLDQQTEIVIVRQRQPTSQPQRATTTDEPDTTSEPNTVITSGTDTTDSSTSTTTQQTTTTANSTDNNGYGPSNGNEGISITYGPPSFDNHRFDNQRYQDFSPYLDWYAAESSKNAVVKAIQGIVNLEDNRSNK